MHFLRTLIIAVLTACLFGPVVTKANEWRPVVLMHGIHGLASDMAHVEAWVREALPGVYVRSMELAQTRLESVIVTMNKQVEVFCALAKNDSRLARGFNLIGWSQGSLIARGYIQRCNDPPVHNFISWTGPQAGQFGTPFSDNEAIDKLIREIPYSPYVQSLATPAQYWKDPYNLDLYLAKSTYLADLNNERDISQQNATYRKHITSLANMVLVKSAIDNIIVPSSSAWFWFYEKGTTDRVVDVMDTDFYKNDNLGLRTLYESQRLHFYLSPCSHQTQTAPSCKDQFKIHTLPFLKNTLP